MPRAFTAVVLAIALTGVSGCGIRAGETSFSLKLGREADSTFDWSGQVAEGQWIEVKGINGQLTAMPASGDSIQVTAVRSGFRSDPNEVEIVVVEHADGVTICAVYPSSGSEPNACVPGDGGRNRTRNNDVKVEFEARVPAGVRFSGRMVNAAIRGRRPHRGRPGADDQRQRPAVDVAGRKREDREWVDQGLVRCDSLGRRVHLRNVNGGIRLEVPEQINADLEIRTTNGRITTDLPITTTRETRRRVEGTLGAGGPDLRLRTVNGSITLGPAE